MSPVSAIYDALFDFESFGRSSPYPVHKKLKLGTQYPDLLDWIRDHVSFSKKDHVLDAGSGTGYSLLKLCQAFDLSGMGLSLSASEVTFARKCAEEMGLDEKAQFEKGSFEVPISAKYDKILAVESIKHSQDVTAVLANLSKALVQEGVLIIADDFIVGESDSRVRRHQDHWHVPGFDRLSGTVDFLTGAGFEVTHFDLTEHVPKRALFWLNLLLILMTCIMPFSFEKRRVKFSVYLGGLILEKLYHLGKVNYHVIIARKPGRLTS